MRKPPWLIMIYRLLRRCIREKDRGVRKIRIKGRGVKVNNRSNQGHRQEILEIRGRRATGQALRSRKEESMEVALKDKEDSNLPNQCTLTIRVSSQILTSHSLECTVTRTSIKNIKVTKDKALIVLPMTEAQLKEAIFTKLSSL